MLSREASVVPRASVQRWMGPSREGRSCTAALDLAGCWPTPASSRCQLCGFAIAMSLPAVPAFGILRCAFSHFPVSVWIS